LLSNLDIISSALSCHKGPLAIDENPPVRQQLQQTLASNESLQRMVLDSVSGRYSEALVVLFQMTYCYPSFPLTESDLRDVGNYASDLYSRGYMKLLYIEGVHFLLRILHAFPIDHFPNIFKMLMKSLFHRKSVLENEDKRHVMQQLIESGPLMTWKIADTAGDLLQDIIDMHSGDVSRAHQMAWDLLFVSAFHENADSLFAKAWVTRLLRTCRPEHIARADTVFCHATTEQCLEFILASYSGHYAFYDILNDTNSLSPDQLDRFNCLRRRIKTALGDVMARHDDVK